MKNRQHGYGFFLLVSIIIYFGKDVADSIVRILLMDSEHRHRMLSDLPILFIVCLADAAMFGLLASPLFFFCLRRKHLSVALRIVSYLVLASTVMVTLIFGDDGGIWQFVALIVSVLLCTLLPNKPPGCVKSLALRPGKMVAE
jgi:hypothetical protein